MIITNGAKIPLRNRSVTLESLMLRAVMYLRGEAIVEAAPDGSHIVCRLGGTPSDPFRGIVPPSGGRRFELHIHRDASGARWVESRVEDNADPFTRDLARGFVRRCAEQWETLFSDSETRRVVTYERKAGAA